MNGVPEMLSIKEAMENRQSYRYFKHGLYNHLLPIIDEHDELQSR